MLINTCYVTNTGKVRKNNEDSVLLNENLVTGNMSSVGISGATGDRLAYMVADGMGGHARGELASSTVLSVFKEGYKKVDSAKDINDLLQQAKQKLNRLAEEDKSSFGLGTTVTGIFLTDTRALLLNCGDSRIYECGETLRKITKDHSLVQELADSGAISEEEMRIHPQKNIITSALMGDSATTLPLYSVREMKVKTGQRFLLCSDGLWESLSDSNMAKCLRDKGIKEGAECLFRESFDAGATDNVSLILLEVAEV